MTTLDPSRSARKAQGFATVLDTGNCPQCFLGLCTKHPAQDHGQRAAALKRASSNARDLVLERFKPKVEKLTEDEALRAQEAYLASSKRDREKLTTKRKPTDRYDGLNATVAGLMRDTDDDSSDDRRREKKRRKKDIKKKHKKDDKKVSLSLVRRDCHPLDDRSCLLFDVPPRELIASYLGREEGYEKEKEEETQEEAR